MPGGGGSDGRAEVYKSPFSPCVRWSIPGYPYGVSLRILIFPAAAKRTEEKKKEASCLPSHTQESFSPAGSGRTPLHAAQCQASTCPVLDLVPRSGAGTGRHFAGSLPYSVRACTLQQSTGVQHALTPRRMAQDASCALGR